jgi:hypothetical protein
MVTESSSEDVFRSLCMGVFVLLFCQSFAALRTLRTLVLPPRSTRDMYLIIDHTCSTTHLPTSMSFGPFKLTTLSPIDPYCSCLKSRLSQPRCQRDKRAASQLPKADPPDHCANAPARSIKPNLPATCSLNSPPTSLSDPQLQNSFLSLLPLQNSTP